MLEYWVVSLGTGSKLQEELLRVVEEKDVLDVQVAALTARLAEIEREKQGNVDQIAQLQAENNQLKSDDARLRADLTALTAVNAETQGRLADVIISNTSLQQKNAELQALRETAQQAIGLRAHNAELEKRLSSAVTAQQDLTTRLAAANTSTNQAQEQVIAANARITYAEARATEMQAQLEANAAIIAENGAKISLLQQSNADLTELHVTLTNQAEQHNVAMQELLRATETATRQLGLFQQEKEDVEEKLRVINAELVDAKQLLSLQSVELLALKAEVEDRAVITQTNEALQSTLIELRRENEDLKLRISELEQVRQQESSGQLTSRKRMRRDDDEQENPDNQRDHQLYFDSNEGGTSPAGSPEAPNNEEYTSPAKLSEAPALLATRALPRLDLAATQGYSAALEAITRDMFSLQSRGGFTDDGAEQKDRETIFKGQKRKVGISLFTALAKIAQHHKLHENVSDMVEDIFRPLKNGDKPVIAQIKDGYTQDDKNLILDTAERNALVRFMAKIEPDLVMGGTEEKKWLQENCGKNLIDSSKADNAQTLFTRIVDDLFRNDRKLQIFNWANKTKEEFTKKIDGVNDSKIGRSDSPADSGRGSPSSSTPSPNIFAKPGGASRLTVDERIKGIEM